MRYTITRLCGGEAILLIPQDTKLILNLDALSASFSNQGIEVRFDGIMIVMHWKKMDVTIYETGKIMFHPLKDSTTAIAYANELMNLTE